MPRPKKTNPVVETAAVKIVAEEKVVAKKSDFDSTKKYKFKNTHVQAGFGLIKAGVEYTVTEEVFNNLKNDLME